MPDREYKGRSIIDFPSEYILIDIESTGLDSTYDKIIELSAIKIIDRQIVDFFTSLVNPKRNIDSYVEYLTGITNDMVKSAPIIKDIFPSFIDFIGNDILIGHNINFDINFLYDNYLSIFSKYLTNDFIDTMRISRKLHSSLKHHRLEDLIKYYKLPLREKHRALSDCEYTKTIYENMLCDIIITYDNLDVFCKLFKKPGSYSAKAKDIVITDYVPDENSPIFNNLFVFTGTLEKMVRKDAMQIVVNMGGLVSDNVTTKTNYLVLGNNDYCSTIKEGKSSKQKKAEDLILQGKDLKIISENVFYDLISM